MSNFNSVRYTYVILKLSSYKLLEEIISKYCQIKKNCYLCHV